MNTRSLVRTLCRFSFIIPLLVFVSAAISEADFSTVYAQSATLRIWDVNSFTGPNPDQTVEDPGGLTGHVATPTNPLTLVTVWENTTHPGGPCGVTYWNPATNTFKWYGVGGGFQASVDMNRTGPVMTGPGGATFRPGDIWAGIPGGSTRFGSHAHGGGEGPLWMNFRNSDRMRSYNVVSVWGIHIASDGQVWFGEYGASSLTRLNPATNTLTRWAIGGGTGFVAIDSLGRVYVTVSGTQQVVRVDPRPGPTANEVVRWPTPAVFQGIPAGFSTPNGIDIDAEGNVWFVESNVNRYGRINVTTNEWCEYTRPGISNPQLIATTGAGATLQAFATEGASAIDIITQVRARPSATCRTITPLRSTLAPTTATVGFFDFTISPRTATITPRTVTVSGTEVNGIARFPVPLGFLSGQTGVVGASTIFGSDLTATRLYEFRSGVIIGPTDRPPVFDSPPTPLSRQTVRAATTLTFDVQASDPDAGDRVTLGVSGLPTGATFPIPAAGNPTRGTFRWTPTVAQIGSHTVTFTARETSGLSAPPRAIEIVVTAAPVDETPPVFIAPTPAEGATLAVDPGMTLSFTVRAQDPDVGDVVTLAATGIPAGASFTPESPRNPVSGSFSWTPILADAGPHPVNFIAQDRAGNAATRRINVVVRGGEGLRPPVFVAPTPAEGTIFDVFVGVPATFTVRASGPDAGTTITLGSTALPAGATFPIPAAANPVQSTFSWTPTAAQTGMYPFTFTAGDNRGLRATDRHINVRVTADTTPPDCFVDLLEGPPRAVRVSIRDRESGLDTITVVRAENVTVSNPPFTRGTTDPVIVTATNVVPALPSRLELRIADRAGNVTECDPIEVRVDPGEPVEVEASKLRSSDTRGFRCRLENSGADYLRLVINETELEFYALDDKTIDWQGEPLCDNNACYIPLEGVVRFDLTDYLGEKAASIYAEVGGAKGTYMLLAIYDYMIRQPEKDK